MSLIKLHVKKGDNVQILSGKDKGKQGKIISALPNAAKVIVEGINKVKRHSKPSLKVPQGGIVSKEMPIHACKVQLICPACNKPTRISHKKALTKCSRLNKMWRTGEKYLVKGGISDNRAAFYCIRRKLYAVHGKTYFENLSAGHKLD